MTTQITRRAFNTTLVAGFALAAHPLRAESVVTSSDGIQADDVTIPTATGPIPAYRARPSGVASPPLLLVVQEIFGLHEHIRDVCRRFAQQGFYALAPSLYHRHGDAGAHADVAALIKEIVAKVPDSEVLSDLDDAVTFAAGDGAGAERPSITGFCWGGRIVWLYAAHRPTLRAGVAWYGRLRGVPDPLHPTHPLDVVPALAAPVLGLYGGQDTGIPGEDVEAMRGAMEAAGKPGRLDVFPDSGHAFFADYRPSYREADAVVAWGRCLEFLRSAP